MYFVLGSDGREYGPIDLETLRTWTLQGRVSSITLIRRDTQTTQIAASYWPELQGYLAPPMMSMPEPLQQSGIRRTPGGHSVFVAAILSLCCILGFGQFYNGQMIKGVVLILVSIVAAVITAGFSILLTLPVSILDAILIAQRLNRGETVRDWQWF